MFRKRQYSSQKDLIRKHLESLGKITSMDAFKKYGITRLSAVIFSLREKGMKIISLDTNSKNRYGKNVKFSTYALKNKKRRKAHNV